MKQRIILVTVAIVFLIFIGTLTLITIERGRNLFKTIKLSNPEDLSNVIFYKDFMRDTDDLELPMDKPGMKKSFLNQLKNLASTNVTIKTYKVNSCTTVHFNLKTYKDKLIEVEIFNIQELGRQAFVSLSVEGFGSFPAGDYLSDGFLNWIESVAGEPGFENITEIERYNQN